MVRARLAPLLLVAAVLAACAGPGSTQAPPPEPSHAAPTSEEAAPLEPAFDPGVEVVQVVPAPSASGPRVLAIVAHPDDETAFAGAMFKIRTHLDGACDVLQITNGEGGFKYSTLGERVYGLELTEEAVGREHLPHIRRQEFLAGVRWIELRRAIFLNQTDHRYTRDPWEVLAPDAGVWDLDLIARTIDRVLAEGGYDFVFVHRPVPTTHGHHQAASVLALQAVERMAPEARPVVLAARTVERDQEREQAFIGLPDFPVTSADPDGPVFEFDRRQGFGFKRRLNYGIVVDWLIAEHKSQGTMQLYMGRGDIERYSLFHLAPADAVNRCRRLFDRLAEPQFATKTYGESAGTNVR